MSTRRNLIIRTVATIVGDFTTGVAIASLAVWIIETAALGLFLSFLVWLLGALGALAFSQFVVHPATSVLLCNHKLDAVVSLPSGVFKPYAGVSTAILFFTKTNSGGTDFVWFYDVDADGLSLDDKRTPLLPEDRLGAVPRTALVGTEHEKNNLPDVLARWTARDGAERARPRTAQSFCVAREEIVAQGYDLSLNRYKEVVHEAVEHRAPREILEELGRLEEEIQRGMKELEGMLG